MRSRPSAVRSHQTEPSASRKNTPVVQSLLDQFLAQEVGLGLMVHLVEGDAQGGVGLVETGIDPAVHHGPQGADLRILLLPLDEHLVGLLQGRGGLLGLVLGHPLLHELLDLGLVHLVEGHVAVAHEVVALDAGGFRGLALELLLPGQHGLADVDAAVVDDRGLDDLVAAGLQQAGHAVTEEVVADMAEVEGLVRVRGGELHHDALAGGGELAERLVGGDLGEGLVPIDGGEGKVQETLHGVEGRDLGDIVHEPLADRVPRRVGGAVGDLQKREGHEGVVALELLPGHGDLEAIGLDIRPVQGLDGLGGLVLDEFFRCHYPR